jgi:PAS domain S-box-containing protein/TyrR family helix-turn-helix protein
LSSIQEAAALMLQYQIDGIPVVNDDNGKLVGLITKTHIFRALSSTNIQISLRELMKKNVMTISETAKLGEALQTPVGRLPVINKDKKLVGIVTRTDLVSAYRWQLENALEEMNTIINSVHNCIIAIDSEARIKFMNKATEKLTGITIEEGIGKAIEEIIPSSSLPIVMATGICHYLKKNIVSNIEFLVSETPITNKGEIVGAVGIYQKKSEVESISHELKPLQTANDELSTIIDFSEDGIVIANGEGIILKCNNASREILGITKENLIGLSVKWLVEHGYNAESVILKVIEQKKRVSIFQHLKNGREILHTGTPIFDEKGNVYRVVVNMRDLTELNYLRVKLKEAQNLSLKYYSELEQYRSEQLQRDFIFKSEAIEKVLQKAIRVARVDTTVLLLGESGAGKEEIAKIIHEASERVTNSCIKLNCAAIPPNLIEAELFGYEGGTFTGASKDGRPGLFEIADNGTLFLDEIGELPFSMQSKLLRFLQEREIYRVGGRKPIKLDVRIIAATNRNLEQMLIDGDFRQDLYYRLNVISIVVPPLRERKEDIPPLISHFLQKYNKKYNMDKKISPQLVESLINFDWPGNIRELENTIERMVVLSFKNLIDVDFLSDSEKISPTNELTNLNLRAVLEETEKKLITKVYQECKSTRKAAKLLGVDQSTIVKKLKKYALNDANSNQ